MATVRKRKWIHKGVEAEAWIVAYRDQSGKRRQETFEKKKDADKRRLEIEVEIEGGIHTPTRDSITVAELGEAFICECYRRHEIGDRMSGYSIEAYKSAVKQVVARFGSTKVSELKAEHVQVWVDDLIRTRKRVTVHHRATTLLVMLKLAVKRKWVKRNVLVDDRISLPARRDREVRVPTKDQINQLLVAIDNPNLAPQHFRTFLLRRTAVCLALFAGGMRRGEIAGLQWENVDFEKGVIRIRHSLSPFDGLKGPKSDAGVRDIAMVPRVRSVLLDLRRYWILRERVWRERGEHDDSKSTLTHRLNALLKRDAQPLPSDPPLTGYVIRTVTKASFTGMPLGAHKLGDTHWKMTMRAAGLADAQGRPLFTMHAMRHACASLLIEQGLPAMNLKRVIGHASVSTTYNVYGYLFPSDRREGEALVAIASAFDAATEQQSPSKALH